MPAIHHLMVLTYFVLHMCVTLTLMCQDTHKILHWIPVEAHIRYKLCLLIHMKHTGRCPPYLKDVLLPVSSSSGRSSLRLATTAQYVKHSLRTVFGDRHLIVIGALQDFIVLYFCIVLYFFILLCNNSIDIVL